MDPYHYQTMYDPRGFPIIHPQPYLQHPVAGALGDSRVRGGGSGARRRPGAKLSTDPQSVAARERRHRISDRFRVLRSLVPGGSKMDTVSMLEQAIHYVKFLKTQISLHQAALMQHEEGCHAELAAYSAVAVVGDNEVTLASHGRTGACDEMMQLQVAAEEALSYGVDAHQPYGLDPRQLSGGHELPPLPASCIFLEEPADACYSVCDLDDGDTGLPGSY
ncbi:barren stalk 1 [Zea mays]|jgi:hypothetical protein|uniref:BHLH transcription factor n=6 Tax=Zea mays TaxID=4577 RepID=Q5MP56_MAIZE|eukprot:NP_001105271.1 barren stalk 1 [Zea mays]